MRAFLDRLRVNLEARAAHLGGAAPLSELLAEESTGVPDSPDTPESYYAMQREANAARTAQDFERAIAIYYQILEKSGNFVPAWLGVGMALMELDRLDEAKTSFLTARNLRPEDVNAHYLLGNVEMKLGNTAEAVQNWGNATLVQRDFLPALNRLVPMLSQVNPTQAEAICRDAIALGPRVAEFHLLLGLTLAEMGRLEEAITELEICLEHKPNIAEARLNLVRIYVELKDTKRARLELTALLAAYPDLPEALVESERVNALSGA